MCIHSFFSSYVLDPVTYIRLSYTLREPVIFRLILFTFSASYGYVTLSIQHVNRSIQTENEQTLRILVYILYCNVANSYFPINGPYQRVVVSNIINLLIYDYFHFAVSRVKVRFFGPYLRRLPRQKI